MSNSFGRWFFGLEKKQKGYPCNSKEGLYLLEGLCTTEEEATQQEISPEIFRPISFSEYMGQERIKETTQSFIQSCKERGKAFPHTLICGSAGQGKTTLARIIAHELGIKHQEFIASNITSADIIAKGGVIFIDEIHALERSICEKFYIAMEDGILDGKRVPNLTIIGATTEVGEILKSRKPFYDRFKLILELEDYKLEEIYILLAQYNKKQYSQEPLHKQVLELIASNSRLTPRTGIRLLEATVALKDINKVLRNNNIIKDGYTEKDLKILEYLKANEKGVGLAGLTGYLGTSEENYIYQIENYLLRQGLLIRSARGRKISPKGLLMIEELKQ